DGPEALVLLQREGEDDGVQADHAMFLAADVEIMPFHFLGILLEGHDGADGRHLAEGVGTLVESVPPPHHLAVTDRRTLRAVHPHLCWSVGEESNEQVDAVHLEVDVSHGTLW